jgi:phospholipase C
VVVTGTVDRAEPGSEDPRERIARSEASSPPTPSTLTDAPDDAATRRLDAIDHIVVLMLSGRSFDHMLGYLSLPAGALGGNGRRDVDGLRRVQAAPSWHLEDTALTGQCEGDPTLGFYDGDDLPVYDHLASQYCVVDRWFSSTNDGAWSNRVFAIAGRAPERPDRSPDSFSSLPSFPRHLDEAGVPWRWYSYFPGTLRAVDPRYRLGSCERFSFVDSRKLSANGTALELGPSFLEDAAHGRLPAVSWIDPCFGELRVLASTSNDDSPHSDVLAGQDLVLMVYNALCSAPTWERTLLIVTYDDAGPFYDHIPPPESLGTRVPALLVSPLVGPGVSSTDLLDASFHFDHASIAKTILTRFCRRGGQVPAMSDRVAGANHLGHLLSEDPPRPEPADYSELAALMASWQQRWIADRYRGAPPTMPFSPSEFQRSIFGMTRRLHDAGLPAAHP